MALVMRALSSSSSRMASPIIVSVSLLSWFPYMWDLLAVKVMPVRQAKPTGYVKAAAPTAKEHKRYLLDASSR